MVIVFSAFGFFFNLEHCKILENSFFCFLYAVMIAVKDFLGVSDGFVIGGKFAPRHIHQPIQVISYVSAFGIVS